MRVLCLSLTECLVFTCISSDCTMILTIRGRSNIESRQQRFITSKHRGSLDCTENDMRVLFRIVKAPVLKLLPDFIVSEKWEDQGHIFCAHHFFSAWLRYMWVMNDFVTKGNENDLQFTHVVYRFIVSLIILGII